MRERRIEEINRYKGWTQGEAKMDKKVRKKVKKGRKECSGRFPTGDAWKVLGED